MVKSSGHKCRPSSALVLVVVSVLNFVGCGSRPPSPPPPKPLTLDEKAAKEGGDFLFQEDFDKAIEGYTKAIQLNPQKPEYLLDRGIARKGKLDYDGAIADFDEAIRLNPNLSGAYYNRGKTFEAKGQPDRAAEDLTKATQLDSQK